MIRSVGLSDRHAVDDQASPLEIRRVFGRRPSRQDFIIPPVRRAQGIVMIFNRNHFTVFLAFSNNDYGITGAVG